MMTPLTTRALPTCPHSVMAKTGPPHVVADARRRLVSHRVLWRRAWRNGMIHPRPSGTVPHQGGRRALMAKAALKPRYRIPMMEEALRGGRKTRRRNVNEKTWGQAIPDHICSRASPIDPCVSEMASSNHGANLKRPDHGLRESAAILSGTALSLPHFGWVNAALPWNG